MNGPLIGSIAGDLFASKLASRLLLASIDFILVGGVIILLILFVPRLAPRLRYWLCLLAMLKPMATLLLGTPGLIPLAILPPVQTLKRESSAAQFAEAVQPRERTGRVATPAATPAATALEDISRREPVATEGRTGPHPAASAGRPNIDRETAVSTRDRPRRDRQRAGLIRTILVTLWLLGVAVMATRSLLARWHLRRLVGRSDAASLQIQRRVDEWTESFLGSGRTVPVRLTSELTSPAATGLIRPLILLPHWITRDQKAVGLEWACRHELNHIRARDLVWSLVGEVNRIFFFFHPLSWWIVNKWQEEMEMSCDEAIVKDHKDATEYSDQLFRLHQAARHEAAPSVGGLFAGGTAVVRRIDRILRGPGKRPRKLTCVLVFCAACSALMVSAAPQQKVPSRQPGTEGTSVSTNQRKNKKGAPKRLLRFGSVKIATRNLSRIRVSSDKDKQLRLTEITGDVEVHIVKQKLGRLVATAEQIKVWTKPGKAGEQGTPTRVVLAGDKKKVQLIYNQLKIVAGQVDIDLAKNQLQTIKGARMSSVWRSEEGSVATALSNFDQQFSTETLWQYNKKSAIRTKPLRTQLLLSKPTAAKFAFDINRDGVFEKQIIAPARVNLPAGTVRFRISNIESKPGLELYGTVEIPAPNAASASYLAHNAILLQLTEEDLTQVLSGRFVTKVSYLPKPKFQSQALAGVETVVGRRLDPGKDPTVEATRRGSILTIFRIGNRQ